jgi:hypothetical protein
MSQNGNQIYIARSTLLGRIIAGKFGLLRWRTSEVKSSAVCHSMMRAKASFYASKFPPPAASVTVTLPLEHQLAKLSDDRAR